MRISDWSSDVCSSDLDGPRRHEHPLGRGNPGDLRLDELTRHELPCPVLQRCADIDGPGIGMDAGIDECYRRPSEFDLTVIGHQANENGAALNRILPQLGFQIGRASCRESVCQYV